MFTATEVDEFLFRGLMLSSSSASDDRLEGHEGQTGKCEQITGPSVNSAFAVESVSRPGKRCAPAEKAVNARSPQDHGPMAVRKGNKTLRSNGDDDKSAPRTVQSLKAAELAELPVGIPEAKIQKFSRNVQQRNLEKATKLLKENMSKKAGSLLAANRAAARETGHFESAIIKTPGFVESSYEPRHTAEPDEYGAGAPKMDEDHNVKFGLFDGGWFGPQVNAENAAPNVDEDHNVKFGLFDEGWFGPQVNSNNAGDNKPSVQVFSKQNLQVDKPRYPGSELLTPNNFPSNLISPAGQLTPDRDIFNYMGQDSAKQLSVSSKPPADAGTPAHIIAHAASPEGLVPPSDVTAASEGTDCTSKSGSNLDDLCKPTDDGFALTREEVEKYNSVDVRDSPPRQNTGEFEPTLSDLIKGYEQCLANIMIQRQQLAASKKTIAIVENTNKTNAERLQAQEAYVKTVEKNARTNSWLKRLKLR